MVVPPYPTYFSLLPHLSYILCVCLMIIYLYTSYFLQSCLGGVFKLELFLPEEYPMAAPKVLQLGFSLLAT